METVDDDEEEDEEEDKKVVVNDMKNCFGFDVRRFINFRSYFKQHYKYSYMTLQDKIFILFIRDQEML